MQTRLDWSKQLRIVIQHPVGNTADSDSPRFVFELPALVAAATGAAAPPSLCFLRVLLVPSTFSGLLNVTLRFLSVLQRRSIILFFFDSAVAALRQYHSLLFCVVVNFSVQKKDSIYCGEPKIWGMGGIRRKVHRLQTTIRRRVGFPAVAAAATDEPVSWRVDE